MSKTRMINTRFWNDGYIAELQPLEKLLFLYLLTNSHTNICGVYELTIRSMVFETGVDEETVRGVLTRFTLDEKIEYLDGWVIIKNFAKHQKKSTSISVGIQEELKGIPDHIKRRLDLDTSKMVPKLDQRMAVAVRDGFICTYCKKEITKSVDIEIDHVHPRSRGGSTTYLNLVLACFNCNREKGDRTATEYGHKGVMPDDYHANIAMKVLKENPVVLEKFNEVFGRRLVAEGDEIYEVPRTLTNTEEHHLNPNLNSNSNLRTADASTTPIFERKIREKDEEYRSLVKDLAAKDYLSAVKIHQIAIDEFLPYWLERSEGAKKSRWEKEKAFDYQRRFRTWMRNVHRHDFTCTDGYWHRKGESCYHKPPEPDYKNLPVSGYAKLIDKRV